jgi:serine/threonine protein kinase/Tol biopolymer transport system component
MTVSSGCRLGPYEVLAAVGAGGMGEVYRARDTRLGRTVAIKVMRQRVGTLEAETLEREARTIAALNHPHVCALHDVGRDDTTPFLVMEYADGETLASKLRRGPMAIADMLHSAIQIAEALDHAHRHGVIHRDLKPSNIMLTKAGIKVLDFGLATLGGAESLASAACDDGSSTIRVQLTSERTLLGTVHYMAPERLQGADASPASDLFAFGAVVYEMATGRRAFEGTSEEVIGAILRSEPPTPSSIRSDLPPSFDWFIQKALAKNPENRWSAAGDVVEVLRWMARRDVESTHAVNRRNLIPAAVVCAAAALLLAVTLEHRGDAPGATKLMFSIPPPPGGAFAPTPSSVPTPQFALSPDGRRLVFAAAAGHNAPQLWIRSLDALQPEPVAGTAGAEYPFWSPDGQSIGYFAAGSLKRIELAGGPPRSLAAAPNGRGGAWGGDGFILFAPTTQGGLYRVPAAGGDASPLTQVDAKNHEASHRWPQILPDGRHFLYFVQSTPPEAHALYVGDLRTSAPARKIVTSSLSGAFATPDWLLFVVDDALMAARFDFKKLQIIADPAPLVPRVAGSSNFFAAFSVSTTGLLVYASSVPTSEFVWQDRQGRRLGSVGPPAEYVDFRLSPHDNQLAVAEVDPESRRPEVRVLDLARGAKVRITYDRATDASPIWSPDGQRLVFRSNRNGLNDLFQSPANGAGANTMLFQSHSAKYPTDWMPDGSGVVFHTYQGTTGSDIWLLDVNSQRAVPLVQTAFDEMQGQVSPDGRWLAYTSVESGAAEVYVRSMRNANARWQVSAGGGHDPRWRGDGGELFYVSADSRLTAVEFADNHPAAPRHLFEIHVSPPGDPYLSNYDVTLDGHRFLVKEPVHDVTSAPLLVLSNWAASLPPR